MFSVYGKAGRVFRGSMEELRKIGPIAALSRTARVAGVGRDALPSPVTAPGSGSAGPGADLAHRGAMAAYAQNITSQPPRQPLTLVRDIMKTGRAHV